MEAGWACVALAGADVHPPSLAGGSSLRVRSCMPPPTANRPTPLHLSCPCLIAEQADTLPAGGSPALQPAGEPRARGRVGQDGALPHPVRRHRVPGPQGGRGVGVGGGQSRWVGQAGLVDRQGSAAWWGLAHQQGGLQIRRPCGHVQPAPLLHSTITTNHHPLPTHPPPPHRRATSRSRSRTP